MSRRHPRGLQATYLPSEHGIGWWGVPDIPASLVEVGLPAGRPLTIRLAAPAVHLVAPADVEVCVTDLVSTARALASTRRVGGLDASARAWKDISRAVLARRQRADADVIEALADRMPTAGHAVLNDAETAIMSARVLATQFREALITAQLLSDADVRADLRPYQAHGVSWLRDHVLRGEGALLADEMGLGKTLQAISVLATRRVSHPHLVVCPTSLIGNWHRELTRFAPGSHVHRYYGLDRTLPERLPAGAVVLTSYPLLRSDHAISAAPWDVVVFDEAQQLKNSTAQITRAAVGLTANARIAMTGTPVENRLDELWSIMSITNPGLLGPRPRFRQRFVAPIQQRRSETAAATLASIIEPHMLRRTKSEVATELPPRIDSKIICTLTDEQIRLYRRAVERAFATGFGSGIGRSGRVLALLTELKQICNHPAQFLAEDAAGPGRSGKFDRVTEMIPEIVDDGERALVFTQYRAMGDLLAAGLGESLERGHVPFLHGGLSAAQRDELVRAFQEDDDSPPVLILSLRAAGFGLNLTRASHVVHFDRWWNPAVEEQATARAHRIGQQRTLNVHTLITGGTIEDHIERMHQEKQGVADLVTGDASTAFARMPEQELRDLLTLTLDSAA